VAGVPVRSGVKAGIGHAHPRASGLGMRHH
jgi:hypothetical protein